MSWRQFFLGGGGWGVIIQDENIQGAIMWGQLPVFITDCFHFFSFFRELFAILLVKYFSVEQKESLGGVL